MNSKISYVLNLTKIETTAIFRNCMIIQLSILFLKDNSYKVRPSWDVEFKAGNLGLAWRV